MLAATHPFLHQPLFIDPRAEYSENDFRTISKWYSQMKSTEDGKALGMCLSTPFDKHSNITQTRPTPLLVNRLAFNASIALEHITNLTNGSILRNAGWMRVFESQVWFHDNIMKLFHS